MLAVSISRDGWDGWARDPDRMIVSQRQYSDFQEDQLAIFLAFSFQDDREALTRLLLLHPDVKHIGRGYKQCMTCINYF